MVQDVRLPGTPLQALNHFRLQVDSDHSSGGTDKACERNREGSRAGTGFQDGHAFTNVRGKNLDGILSQPAAQGARQQIAHPPGTNTTGHDVKYLWMKKVAVTERRDCRF